MTLENSVVLRSADGKHLDNIDADAAKELLTSKKARIICSAPLIIQLRLPKDVGVFSPSGKELNKTDKRKARCLVRSGRARIIKEKPLVIQMVNKSKKVSAANFA